MLAGLILAKGKSNRLPGKNSLDFSGQPMFAVNVKKCLKIFDRVYVSSDDMAILDLAYNLGAMPIERKEDLCGDVPNIPVYRHALRRMDCDGFVAVQANSPTVEPNLIVLTKRLMEMGIPEVITCHPNREIYGSIWAMTRERLASYVDLYHPNPEVLIVDKSVDIHTLEDYNKALHG